MAFANIERDQEMVRFWSWLLQTGTPHPHKQMAARFGITESTSPSMLTRLRRKGYDVPMGRSGRPYVKCPLCGKANAG